MGELKNVNLLKKKVSKIAERIKGCSKFSRDCVKLRSKLFEDESTKPHWELSVCRRTFWLIILEALKAEINAVNLDAQNPLTRIQELLTRMSGELTTTPSSRPALLFFYYSLLCILVRLLIRPSDHLPAPPARQVRDLMQTRDKKPVL